MEIRKGAMADVEGFLSLLQEVREGMDHKEWFYLDPPEYVREKLASGQMQLWVAMEGNRMAAAFDLLTPGLEGDNYGYDLGFTQEQLLQVVNMDTAVVHPDFRGQGLQRKLLETAEEALTGQGKRYLLCTIHPENRFSLENALKQGYEIQLRKPKYGSVRYVLKKEIF